VGLVGQSLLPPEHERLTTGWEPDVPEDDTLLRQAVLVHASWAVTLARKVGRPWRDEGAWAGGRVGDRGALTNWVVLTRPTKHLGTVLAEVSALFPPDVPYLLVSPWPTPDLRELGLALVGHPPLMVRMPGTSVAPPTRVEVREVEDDDDLAVAERVLVEGYPLPELQPLHPGDVYAPGLLDGATRVWVAWDDDTPLATAAAHLHAGITLVEGVAALAGARGKGAGAAVAWAATTCDPARPAVLIASDDGRPVYARLGYLPVERWTVWLQPGATSGG
jgi:hypothetical protein